MQLLRKLAWPFSLLYGVIVYLRNWFYDIGFFKSTSFRTPSLCIGNLTVGGTGKTPMIEWVLRHIDKKDSVAVLSRGYKRKTKGFLLADSNSDAEEIGDEPLQIFSKFPEVSMVVDEDRSNGIRNIEKIGTADLILLDDAYQHRKVKPTAAVLLTTYGDLFVNDSYLPTGNLRDSKSASKRADIIIVTKCPPSLSLKTMELLESLLRASVQQKVLFCHFTYDSCIRGEKGEIVLEALIEKQVTLVTGIANPTPLLNFLTSRNVSYKHFTYRDHHFYSVKEIALFNTEDLVLTTEKDYMRLKGKVKNLYYLEVRHQFIGEGASIFEELLFKLRN